MCTNVFVPDWAFTAGYRWLPEYNVSPQTLRKMHDTLVDQNVRNPEARQLMFHAAGHTEDVAVRHYVASRDVENAARSIRLYQEFVHPHIMDPLSTSRMLGVLIPPTV